MLAALFEAGGQRQERLGRESIRRLDCYQLGLAFRERAGLIDDERIDQPQGFERSASRNSTPMPARRARADHDRHRSRQAQRAGAGDDQDGDGVDQAWASRGSRPQIDQPANVNRATSSTAGTKTAATLLTSFSIGARLRWAWPTMLTI